MTGRMNLARITRGLLAVAVLCALTGGAGDATPVLGQTAPSPSNSARFQESLRLSQSVPPIESSFESAGGGLLGDSTRQSERAAEELPPAGAGERRRTSYEIPLSGPATSNAVKMETRGGRITLLARNAPLRDVLNLLAQQEHLNMVCSDDVNAQVSITLTDVPLEDALTAIVSVGGCTWVGNRGIIYVTNASSTVKFAPDVQDRRVRVFHLDYVTAAVIDDAVKGMLSTSGMSYVMASDPLDNRKTHEALVVEDMPPFLDRIEQYIWQVDVPPRQVQIEVHVLEVELKDDFRHGVNMSHLMSMASGSLQLEALGFANTSASQGMMLRLNGGDIAGLVELLQTTTDAKTLASPRVQVVSGQESRIQVGQQLGFSVAEQTQTSTIQSVQFLDVGVVLSVTPRIGRDNRVLLRVKPEVSTGAVNAETGMPEKGTSEVATDVLLDDGQAIVIGGLIQERDSNTQSKIPLLGDLKYIGHLFQKRELAKRRSEVIFVLTPRIMPGGPCWDQRTQHDVLRARTPLLSGPLVRVPRPWEPQLTDPSDNPAKIWPPQNPFASSAIPHGPAAYPGPPIPFGSSHPAILSRLPPTGNETFSGSVPPMSMRPGLSR